MSRNTFSIQFNSIDNCKTVSTLLQLNGKRLLTIGYGYIKIAGNGDSSDNILARSAETSTLIGNRNSAGISIDLALRSGQSAVRNITR